MCHGGDTRDTLLGHSLGDQTSIEDDTWWWWWNYSTSQVTLFLLPLTFIIMVSSLSRLIKVKSSLLQTCKCLIQKSINTGTHSNNVFSWTPLNCKTRSCTSNRTWTRTRASVGSWACRPPLRSRESALLKEMLILCEYCDDAVTSLVCIEWVNEWNVHLSQ